MGDQKFLRCSGFRGLNNLFSCLHLGACFGVPKTAPERLLAASGLPLGSFWALPEALSGKFLHVFGCFSRSCRGRCAPRTPCIFAIFVLLEFRAVLAGGAAPPGPPAYSRYSSFLGFSLFLPGALRPPEPPRFQTFAKTSEYMRVR